MTCHQCTHSIAQWRDGVILICTLKQKPCNTICRAFVREPGTDETDQ